MHEATQQHVRPPDARRLAEDLRSGLSGIDAAAAGIAAAMRENTLAPDDAWWQLTLITDALKAKADALVAAMAGT